MFFNIFRYTNPVSECWNDCTTTPISTVTIQGLSLLEHEYLFRMYSTIYPNFDWQRIEVPFSIYRTSEVIICGEIFGSLLSRNHKSGYIVAHWTAGDGNIANFENYVPSRPGVIEYFFKHSLIHKEEHLDHWFAKCKWFLPSPDDIRNKYGKPVEIWRSLFENSGPASFIPVLRIHSKVVITTKRVAGQNSVIVVPRIRHSNIL